jgi:pimeloyl-ACP methyl ester carboxylesterase
MTEAQPSYRDGYFHVTDGLRLHYRDYSGSPDRPPLVCLPGLTRNCRDFESFARNFSPRHRVLAMDFRGRGLSDYDPQTARYIPITYATDVIEFLDELTIPQAIFVGTSLGGLVTMILASMVPDRIAAAILNDVGPDISREGIDRIRTYLGRDLRFNSWDEAAASIARYYGGAFDRYAHADWVKMAKRNCREENGEIRFDYDMAIAVPFEVQGAAPSVDLWPVFKALGRRPLLVIHGERSDLLTAQALRKMHEAVPGMKSVTVPGVGHAPTLDEPEALAAIDGFLDSLS